MDIVTVKNKYQVVIPRALREKLGINRGDLLEAKVERGRLTYTPKALVDRIPTGKAARERYFQQMRDEAPAWLKAMWTASKRRGTDSITMREINSEISAARRQKKKQPAR